MGCNNTCTFCIVPSLRGKEKDRRPGDILDEIRALVADGVLEVTLLGQNVNSYGAEFGDRNAFGKLLRACGEIEGLERVRFTSPHPRDFTDDVIDAMAETPNVMPSLHMPLQSGSDRILKAMRRAYRRDRYLAILDRVRASIPDAAITTDIIVGFPGETEQDFEDTLDLVRQARFAGAFTFRYSIRAGTPAATMDAQVPAEIVQERYERLTALVEETTYAENQKLAGATVEVLVAEGEGRKDAATHRMSGRARDNRLVHFTPDQTAARPGDVVTVTVTRGAPHYLLSDAAPLAVRRTRAGDAWQAAAARASRGCRVHRASRPARHACPDRRRASLASRKPQQALGRRQDRLLVQARDPTEHPPGLVVAGISDLAQVGDDLPQQAMSRCSGSGAGQGESEPSRGACWRRPLTGISRAAARFWRASVIVRASGIWRSRPVMANSRRIWCRAQTACRLAPCAAARLAALASTPSPDASMKVTRSRLTISGRPLAAGAASRSRSRGTVAMSISPATVTSMWPGSWRTSTVSP